MPAAVVLDRSKPIPASQLIGREAMVTFAPDKNGYSRINSVVPAPRVRQPAAAPALEPRQIIPTQQEAQGFGAAGPQPAAAVPTSQPGTDDLPF
jgi:hypothetical protein